MTPQQIEALAELVGAEMDRKMAGVRSRAELDKILAAFAEGSGRVTKKQIADVRDRLLGKIDSLERQLEAVAHMVDEMHRGVGK